MFHNSYSVVIFFILYPLISVTFLLFLLVIYVYLVVFIVYHREIPYCRAVMYPCFHLGGLGSIDSWYGKIYMMSFHFAIPTILFGATQLMH